MRNESTVAAVVLLAAMLATVMSGTAAAQPAGTRPEASANPIVVYTRDRASAAAARALTARTREKGEIRVIVGLDLAMRHEDTLSTQQQAAQGRTLSAMQDAMLQRSLPNIAAGRVVRFETVPFLSVRVDADQLQRIFADPQVVSVNEDVPVPPSLQQSVPLIQADKLWSKGVKGASTTVAILDTGAHKPHNMLTDDIVKQACFSTNDGANVRSFCPNRQNEQIGGNAGRDCPLNVTGCGHGTHVASIAAGFSTRNRGVSFQSDLIIVQVFRRLKRASDCSPRPAPCASSSFTDIGKGLEQVFKWRNNRTIAAVNMSLGGGQYSSTCDGTLPAIAAIIEKLRKAGIATVIASGNEYKDGFIGAPACISHAIAVGSSTKSDEVSDFSNHAPLVKVLAPGSNIKAAKAGTRNGLTVMSGTSMATPHVAGAFGLLRDFRKRATVDEIITALICTGRRIKRPAGNELRKPRIKLLDAWRYLRRPPTSPQRWDFRKAADGDDWEALLGKWRAASGNWVLQRFNPDNVWNASWHPNCNQKLRVDAVMRRVDAQGKEQTIFWNSGMILKADVDDKTNAVSGFWFAYNGFSLDEEDRHKGQAVIWRMDNFNLATNSGGGTLLCTKNNAGVKIGRYNQLRIVSRGATHQFYLNGNLVCTATDGSYVAGSIGLVTAVPNPVAGNQNLKVDWIEITPLDRAKTDAVAEAPTDAEDATVHPAKYRPLAIPRGMTPLGTVR
jgi:subtilisin family serine protease